MHIAIAGNIGSGKTTLTTLLSKHFKWKAHYEDVENNPYLNDFYKEMQRWAFNLQVYFLNSRFRQIIDIKNSGEKKINAINELNSLIMPDLNDFGINELIPILENAGFSVVIDGNGLNVSQSILPGTKLSKGQEIKI